MSGLPSAARPSSVETASSWVLRIGVVASLAVMSAGLVTSFWAGGVTVREMETRPFVTDVGVLRHGIARLDPFSLMELGVLLLVLTPIVRVFTSMVIFAVEEHDALYSVVTGLVLAMTLASLVLIR